MSPPETSIAFDRAAAYYDQTRKFSAETEGEMIEVLSAEFGEKGPILEVGVGTGQVALPLAAGGVRVVGIDLARPMMERLVAKAGGRSPFPLVEGDATGMPFADDAFDGAYLRWVLHLIPDWRGALTEIARVCRPGTALVTILGSYGGPRSEIQERFAELAGISIEPVGLTWDGFEPLDAAMEVLGAVPRDLPRLVAIDHESLGAFVDAIANNRYSWTWKLGDPALLPGLADEVRAWAQERFGPLDQVHGESYDIGWRAYDLVG